jgi:hypothetical protein
MTNYRVSNILEVSSTSTAPTNAWGVMRMTATCSGSVVLEGGSTLKLEYIAQGQPLPCYVKSVTVTSGLAYILS